MGTSRSCGILPVGRPHARKPWFLSRGSIALGFAGVVPGVIDTARSFMDSSLRVWAKRAGHVDTTTFVDSSGCDGFGGLVLFAPTFQRSESVELIEAGATAAVGHAGDH